MNIGFDAKRLFNNFTGLGNYSRSLVKTLSEQYPQHRYFLYSPRIQRHKESDFVFQKDVFNHRSNATFLKNFWRSYSIYKSLRADQIQIYHGLSHEIPFSFPQKNIKTVVTIHDLIFKVYPSTYPAIDRLIYDTKFRFSSQNADAVIAISEHTKTDLIHFYGIAPEKISVIPPMLQPVFWESETAIKPLKLSVQLPSEFFLYVGSVMERKNLKTILKVYRHLTPDFQLPLVIVGNGEKRYKKEVKELILKEKIEEKIIWLENMNDNNTLKYLYQKAQILLYPSIYEGFGLPVAEALCCRTPVLTSRLSSLPEAGGAFSFYLDDPKNEEAMADGISIVLSDTKRREAMRVEGFAYAKAHFQSKKLAEKVMNLYQSVF